MCFCIFLRFYMFYEPKYSELKRAMPLCFDKKEPPRRDNRGVTALKLHPLLNIDIHQKFARFACRQPTRRAVKVPW